MTMSRGMAVVGTLLLAAGLTTFGAGAASAAPAGAARAGAVISGTAAQQPVTQTAAQVAAPHPAAAKAAAKTKVKRVTPFFADGRIRFGQNWDADAVTLDRLMCGRSLVAQQVKGVYSCGGGASYLPACWINPSGAAPEVLCMRTAGDEQFIAGYLDGPPPKAPKRAAYDPWRIVLAGGVKCDSSSGMPWADPPADMIATYWCSDGSVLLAKSGKRTYAKKSGMVRMQKTVSPDGAVQRVHAKRVVYAGAAPKVAKAKKGAACPSPAALTRALPAGTRLEASASEGIWCARGWAYAATWNGFNVGVGLFKKTSSGWKLRDRSKVCEVPGPVPAALYVACTVN